MKRISLRPEEWPSQDRDLWTDLFRKGHPLDGRGPLHHYRPASVATMTAAYGHWLAWVTRERSQLLSLDPIVRAQPEVIVEWLASMTHLAPRTAAARLECLTRILRLYLPPPQLAPYERVQRNYRRLAATRISNRKDGRIVETTVLVEAGLRLYNLNQKAAASDVTASRTCRDALMIVLLALMPMRRRPFAALELGRTVLRSGSGWKVVLEESDLKVGQFWESRVHEPLESLLNDYVDVVRPKLLQPGSSACNLLWLNNQGRPYEPSYLGVRIKELTTRHVGRAISPHLFRDCAATTLALSSARMARLTRSLLGHSTDRTGTRYYNQATSIEAGRILMDVVTRRKKGA